MSMKKHNESSAPYKSSVYTPKLMQCEFSRYDLMAISRVSAIKVGNRICTCSVQDEPLAIQIEDRSFLYSRLEKVHVEPCYSFIEKAKINEREHFLYYEEHPSKGDTLGWSIYTITSKTYDHLKYGKKLSDVEQPNEFSLLGKAYIPYAEQCIPYVVAAIANNMKIMCHGGETWCE